MKTKILVAIFVLVLIGMTFLWFEKWVVLGYTSEAVDRQAKEISVLKKLIASSLSPSQLIEVGKENEMFVSRNTDSRFWPHSEAKLAIVVEGTTFYFDEENNYIEEPLSTIENPGEPEK